MGTVYEVNSQSIMIRVKFYSYIARMAVYRSERGLRVHR